MAQSPVEFVPTEATPLLPPNRRLTLFGLMALAFFSTSGGAFGIEPLIGALGPGRAVVVILLAPLAWSLPMGLMVAELSALLPVEGGFYIWVREALGPFWAVQEAWWTMGYSLALMAIFPVLFADYLGYFIPSLDASSPGSPASLHPWLHWLVATSLVASATFINLRGSREVGSSAVGSAIFIVGAFVALVVVAAATGHGPGAGVRVALGDVATAHPGSLLMAASILVLNFSGWDSVSTYAGEVDRPQHNYPRAIAGALFAVVLGYLLPVLVGISVTVDPALWSDAAGWPAIARLIGGDALGDLIACTALVAMWALYNAQLLYASRLPCVMAADGWLPARLEHVADATAVPATSIVMFSILTSALCALSFTSLTVILCLLNVASVMLEFLCLLVMRVRQPGAPRSFRIPGRAWGLAYVCGMPALASIVLLVVTLGEWRSFPAQLLIVGIVVLSGPLVYVLGRSRAAARRMAHGPD